MMHITTPGFVVNVRELLRSPGARRHVSLRRPLGEVGVPVAAVPEGAPVAVEVDVDHVVEGLLVSGEITAPVRLSCVRCLTEVDSELRVEVRELFTRGGRTPDDEDEGYTVLPGDTLALDTMVRDALVLAFPTAPLCRPDCAGLCPVCGADRNTTSCGHDDAPADPRWLPLAGLRERQDRQDR